MPIPVQQLPAPDGAKPLRLVDLGNLAVEPTRSVRLVCHDCGITWGGCAAECCCPNCGREYPTEPAGLEQLRLVDAPATAPSRNSLALAYGLTLSLEHVLYIRPAIDLLGAVLRREPRVYVVRVEDEDGVEHERWLEEDDISELAMVLHCRGFAAAASEAERKGWL